MGNYNGMYGPGQVFIVQSQCGTNFHPIMDPRLAPYMTQAEYQQFIGGFQQFLRKEQCRCCTISIVAFAIMVLSIPIAAVLGEVVYEPGYYVCEEANGNCFPETYDIFDTNTDDFLQTENCCSWQCCEEATWPGMPVECEDMYEVRTGKQCYDYSLGCGEESEANCEIVVTGETSWADSENDWAMAISISLYVFGTVGSMVAWITWICVRRCQLPRHAAPYMAHLQTKGITGYYIVPGRHNLGGIVLNLPQQVTVGQPQVTPTYAQQPQPTYGQQQVYAQQTPTIAMGIPVQ